MIPATQRPDGSWRKARRTRKGFDPTSGGVPRYVPPAYRNAGGGHDSGEDSTNEGGHHTRSLTEVESFRPGARRGRHLPAALFLRTASTALPPPLSPNHERKRGSSAERAPLTAATTALVRSAMREAEEQLGCGICRLIVSEERLAEEDTANSFSKGPRGNDGTRDWWAQLRQVERGSETEEPWIGIELSLRWSDVYCSDGQAAIIGFMRSLVGPKEKEDGERKSRYGVKAGPRKTTANPEDGRGGTPSSEGEEKERSVGASREGPEDQDSDSVGVGGVVAAAAVLVFGGELSKRDRAGLHGQAENTVGVVSTSQGVGDARFLALRCGLGGGSSTPAGFELSREQEELSRRLFRLAQQEYHSRYERLSHREIREVVALGGPRAEDHPDLFQLLERTDHGVDPDVPRRP